MFISTIFIRHIIVLTPPFTLSDIIIYIEYKKLLKFKAFYSQLKAIVDISFSELSAVCAEAGALFKQCILDGTIDNP